MKRANRLLNQEYAKKKIDNNAIAIASTSNDGVILLYDYEGECYHLVESEAEWMVDTDALYHYVPKIKEILHNLQN